MKNLKKVLSLSLALVMLLGMMIMPQANAAGMTYTDLVDKDDITNLPEVALLVDLGIIEGKTGNVYDPTGIVDRATMAKLVTTLHFGAADANQFLGATSDLIDIKGNWAEGFILYCYTQGIIAGDGMGKFFPSNEVTVAEAAKMLLVTLGYDPIKAGLVGADWAVNTISTATKAGILSGVTLRSSDKVDRDSIALMMYNTLFAQQVAYNSLFGNEPISKNNTLGLATYGLVKVEGLVTSANKDKTTLRVTEVTPSNTSGAATLFNVTGSYDLGGQQAFVGKNVAIYLKYTTKADGTGGNFLAASVMPDKFSKVYSSELTEIPGGVLAVSHNGTILSELITNGHKNYLAPIEDTTNANVTVFYNDASRGNYVTATTAAKADLDTITDKTGVVVSFIDNDGNGKAEVIWITEYTTVKVLSVSTAGNGKVTFSAGLVHPDRSDWTSLNVVGFEDLEKDAIVYGYVDVPNKTLKVFVPDRIEGTMSSFKGTDVTVDGKTYKRTDASSMYTAGTDVAVNDNLSGVVELFLDSNGYYVAGDLVEGAAKPYLYIKSAETAPYGTQRATAVFSDGTEKAINVYKVGGKTIGTVDAGINYTISATENTANPYSYEVYTYIVNDDGTYNLTQDGSTGTSPSAFYYNEPTTAVETKKGVSLLGGSTAQAIRGDSNTIYVDVKNNEAYTGIQNVPGMTGTGYATAVKDGFAKVVFIVGVSGTTDNSTKVYVYDTRTSAATTAGNSTGSYVIISAVVDGEPSTDVKLSTAAWDAIKDTSSAFGTGRGLYTVDGYETVAGQRVISGLTLDAAAGGGTVSAKGTDAFVVGTGATAEAFAINADTKYVVIEQDSFYTGSANYDAASAAIGTYGNIIFGTGLTSSDVIVTRVSTSSTAAGYTTAKVVYVIADANKDAYTGVGAITYAALGETAAVAGGTPAVAAPAVGAITKNGASYTTGTYTYTLDSKTVVGAVVVNADGSIDITANAGNIENTEIVVAWTYTDGTSYTASGTVTIVVGP